MEPKWVILRMANGDERGIARVRVDEPSDVSRAVATTRVAIDWDYPPEVGGLPSSADAEAMADFERHLDDLSDENGNSVLMLVITGAGQKQWVYYVRSTEVFVDHMNQLLADCKRFPIAISAARDNEWEYWREFAKHGGTARTHRLQNSLGTWVTVWHRREVPDAVERGVTHGRESAFHRGRAAGRSELR